MAPLKVFGTISIGVFINDVYASDSYRVIAACPSMAAFIRLLRFPDSKATRAYISQTGNKHEIEIAMSDPGTLFGTNTDKRRSGNPEYVPVTTRVAHNTKEF